MLQYLENLKVETSLIPNSQDSPPKSRKNSNMNLKRISLNREKGKVKSLTPQNIRFKKRQISTKGVLNCSKIGLDYKSRPQTAIISRSTIVNRNSTTIPKHNEENMFELKGW